MKKVYNIIVILIIITTGMFFGSNLKAQSTAMIENIDFYAEGMTLIIKYDIVKANKGELFDIWVKVTTASQRDYIPQTMTGDVGSGVSGGPNKRIVWDLEADNTAIDEEFSVEVFARSNYEEVEVEKPTKEGISPGGAMLLSAILPGLGKTVAKGKGADWMWGVIGYGCIAGSVATNNMAYNSYEDYLDETDPDDRDDLFTQAEQYDTYSKVLVGAAATIWIIDIITTGVKAEKIRTSRNESKFSLNYNMDPQTGQPLVGLTLRF